jgi:DNA-binding NarL/FixJ family response regulator
MHYNVYVSSEQTNVTTQTVSGTSVLTKPKTILIADDSVLVRTMIRQAIERDTEFQVCGEAVDGTDAVTKAKELSPDLIILDVRMPSLNGIEVAGVLRYALPKIRIVLVTMYAQDIERNLTSLFRIDAVLAKAGGLTELTAHVTSLLADRQLGITTASNLDGHLTVQQKVTHPGAGGV